MRAISVVSIIIFNGLTVFAQSESALPAFEVASVKRGTAAVNEMHRVMGNNIRSSPGSLTMTSVRLSTALQWAYHMQAPQISGPSWLDSESYDIVAKSGSPVTEDQMRLMLQRLLTERFKLTFHRETKTLPAYVVTIARGGVKFSETQEEGEVSLMPDGKSGMMVQRSSIAYLTDMAAQALQEPVVDMTGLKGRYDFKMNMASVMAGQAPASKEEAFGIVFKAIEDQLGIKIEPRKVPLEMLVVDHAEKVPIEN